MKKFTYLILFTFVLFINSVNASSINYNVTIDNDMNFDETIVYTIDKNENRSFLKSVLNDSIYFDLDGEIPYTKTKNASGDKTIVTLKHTSSYVFIATDRIIKECFKDVEFTSTPSAISFSSEAPFFCYSRADKIDVNIKTDLSVISSNANTTDGNVYIWNNLNRDSRISFSARTPVMEEEPMDNVDEHSTDGDTNDSDNSSNNSNIEKEQKQTKATYVIFGSIIGGALFIGLLAFLILQKRNKDLNRL